MDSVRCTPEMKRFIPKIDLIVFDIDGVLINTRQSFIATIVDTTRYYIDTILNLPVDLSGLTQDDALQFKHYTGFNNDWDLTEGIVMYQLALYKSGKKFKNIGEFLQKVDNQGGGLPGISAVLEEHCDAVTFEWVQKNVDREVIQKTFQEIYGGEAHCESFYGFSPQRYKGAGSVESETILLNGNILSRWKGSVGILTGRTETETEFALRMLKLTGIDKNLVQFSDLVLPDKPHPAKIVQIVRKASSKNAVYIGDTIDDFLTVINFNRLGEESVLKFGLVSDNSRSFPEYACSFQAPTVNNLIEYIVINNQTK